MTTGLGVLVDTHPLPAEADWYEDGGLSPSDAVAIRDSLHRVFPVMETPVGPVAARGRRPQFDSPASGSRPEKLEILWSNAVIKLRTPPPPRRPTVHSVRPTAAEGRRSGRPRADVRPIATNAQSMREMRDSAEYDETGDPTLTLPLAGFPGRDQRGRTPAREGDPKDV